MKICTVVGARPNFVKMAPIILELRKRGIPQVFVHTGQHYDAKMSQVFFDELGMPRPDEYLGIGSGSHADQTARVMIAFEQTCVRHAPSLVLVAGDVNSTLACALVASKLLIPVGHVESGLRSFDRAMPEEVNRILTDHVSSLHFVTEPSGRSNLLREGIAEDSIHFVGNTMIDSLMTHLDAARALRPWEELEVSPGEYGVVTLHRPSNVDEEAGLRSVAGVLEAASREVPLLFPMHPRTRAQSNELFDRLPNVHVTDPLPYLKFIGLMSEARFVLTDSGGIQEETTALGVRCLTLRRNTERPVTVDEGTNELVECSADAVLEALSRAPRKAVVPHLWDGHAATRLVDVLATWASGR